MERERERERVRERERERERETSAPYTRVQRVLLSFRGSDSSHRSLIVLTQRKSFIKSKHLCDTCTCTCNLHYLVKTKKFTPQIFTIYVIL